MKTFLNKTSKKIFILLVLQSMMSYASPLNTQRAYHIIMLDPAGNTQELGRKLTQGYERGATLKVAEKLKHELSQHDHLYPIISRTAGEEVQPLDVISFANRFKVDLFIRIHVYKEETVKPKIFVYQRVTNSIADFAQKTLDPFAFIPLAQAHTKNIHKTKNFGLKLKTCLTEQPYQKVLDFYGPFGLPIKPLMGITPPALMVEIGVSNERSLESIIPALAHGISSLITI